MPISETTYHVQTLRAGQPKAYADTEREYLISVKPWPFGDIEKRIKEEEALRAKGQMFGGYTPDQARAQQREWALKIVRGLCQNFREKDDQDGRTGMDAAFYPTLKKLTIEPGAGTIRAFIVEMYTD